MLRGFEGLAALAQGAWEQHPFSNRAFVFRGRRDDIVKLLWRDRPQGLCLFAQRLGKKTFIWPPQALSGSVVLTPAQQAMVLEGVD